MPTVHKPASAGTLLGAGLDDMVYALRKARRSVAIATPFLSHPVAGLLVRESSAARSRRLLIALNDVAVAGGYLDPVAVDHFVQAEFEIRSLRNLHAKVVIADERWGILGSGNLTVRGTDGGNAELGIVLTRAQARIAQRQHYDAWWAAAEPLDLAYLGALSRQLRPHNPQRRQRKGQGGMFHMDAGKELAAFVDDPARSGYWLKIMHYRPERAAVSTWHTPGLWISDRHRLREGDNKPLLEPRYKVGDRLVIYLSREGRRACPAIVRLTRTAEFEPKRVRREGMPGDEKLYGWVTEVVAEHVVPIDRAPTLAEIGVASSSVREHSRIKLTHRQFDRALRAML